MKEIESVTNHDVKAVEYFIKEKTNHFLAEKYHEFIHFGLTSQDINNTSVPLSIKDALQEVYYPGLEEVIGALKNTPRNGWIFRCWLRHMGNRHLRLVWVRR